MTTAIDKTAAGSEAATTHGSEDQTNPLAVLGDMAMSEVEETTEEEAAPAAAEGGTTTEGEAAADTTADASETGADGARVTFTPEQQKVFDSRLGREVAKRKTEQEKAEGLQAKVGTLEGELTTLKAAAEGRIPLHPEWAEKADLDTIVETNRLESEVQRLKANWGGIENDDPAKAMTAEQVQQAYAQATAELAALKPKADTAWKTAHQQFVADAKLGRQIRAERAKAAELAKQKPAGAERATATVTPAGQGAAGRTATETPTRRGMSTERFEKAGGNRAAAEKELSQLVSV